MQFRDHADLGWICLRCYQNEILDNGQPRTDYEGSRIHGGMFFSYGNPESRARGFDAVDGFSDYFVNSRTAAERYNSKTLALVDSGHVVLTAYERLAIGGLEGYGSVPKFV